MTQMTNYQQAMGYLKEAEKFCGEMSLKSIKELLNVLGNPQDDLKFIHIGGTNGKGSIAAYCSTVLAIAGYRVGRYVSPTILEYWERIQILEKSKYNHTPVEIRSISHDAVIKHMNAIKNASKLLKEKGIHHPTPFEIETAMAFLEFKQQRCDIVVLEVGMGGKVDATNVIEQVECSVFSSISLDHMNFLGDNLTDIAKEKCGIIKKNVPVVSYEQKKEVLSIIQQECDKKQTSVKVADFSKIKKTVYTLENTVFTYDTYKELRISLLGENQVKNAITSLIVLEELVKKGYHIQRNHIYNGFYNTKWQGRFSIVCKHPLLIVDGAHNAEAAIALEKNIQLYLKNKKIHMIIGVFADKEYELILKYTIPYAQKVYTVDAEGIRTLPSEELEQKVIQLDGMAQNCKTVEKAWNVIGAEGLKEDEAILCFGSLSFLNQIYEVIEKKKQKEKN